jgi:hypothetical protein
MQVAMARRKLVQVTMYVATCKAFDIVDSDGSLKSAVQSEFWSFHFHNLDSEVMSRGPSSLQQTDGSGGGGRI